MSNIDECIICFEILNPNFNITFANCIHGDCVHAKCIIQCGNTCPLCRSVIYNNNHTKEYIQNKIEYNLKQ